MWTIGVGHAATGLPPKPCAGMTITEAQCDDLLAKDLAPVEATIAKAVTVPLSQNEWDALASLGFNIGVSGEAHSTVIKRLNLGDVAGAADAFLMWEKPVSLTSRRVAERAQFLTLDVDTKPIAAARAGVLETKASTAKATAATATKTAAATIVVGGVGSVAAVATHPGAAIAAGGVVGFAAIVQAFAAWWHTKQAGTLTANAAAQRSVEAS